MSPRLVLGIIIALGAVVSLGALFQRPAGRPSCHPTCDGRHHAAHAPADGHERAASPAVEQLEVTDIVTGKGQQPQPGGAVVVEYRAYLADGRLFDGSHLPGKPTRYVLGTDSMPKGLQEGILGMREGGHRRITVPPSLGYGATGNVERAVPPNETLTYDVRLVEVP